MIELLIMTSGLYLAMWLAVTIAVVIAALIIGVIQTIWNIH